jgi:CO/xanthine dehydrogenase Mo-binding subunit
MDGQRAAVLICYEQVLTYPIIASMLQSQAVLIGISNMYWFADTPLPRYQESALRAWARLFHNHPGPDLDMQDKASTDELLNGRGLAYMRYKQAENYVAIAMDVSVEPATGRIVVRRVACAHDSGLIVNPDGLPNQVEECIMLEPDIRF